MAGKRTDKLRTKADEIDRDGGLVPPGDVATLIRKLADEIDRLDGVIATMRTQALRAEKSAWDRVEYYRAPQGHM